MLKNGWINNTNGIQDEYEKLHKGLFKQNLCSYMKNTVFAYVFLIRYKYFINSSENFSLVHFLENFIASQMLKILRRSIDVKKLLYC